MKHSPTIEQIARLSVLPFLENQPTAPPGHLPLYRAGLEATVRTIAQVIRLAAAFLSDDFKGTVMNR